MLKPESDSARQRITILFGAPAASVPKEIEELASTARAELQRLFMAAWKGTFEQAACDELIELATVACARIELLWRDPKKRGFVMASAASRSFFPILHTNLLPESGVYPGDEMRATIALRTPLISGKGKSGGSRPGKPVGKTRLNDEVWRYIKGVLEPGTLRFKIEPHGEETDVVSAESRKRLLRKRKFVPADWANAFLEYVRAMRPDLLIIHASRDPKAPSDEKLSGEFASLVEARWKKIAAQNNDEKGRRHAFQVLVLESLRIFSSAIKSAIR